jgi:glutamyl-tRNA synthetase
MARGRYAPSPTGPMHLGNLRTALLAWLQTRLNDGKFVLRMEDLDLPRCKPGSAEQIVEDLLWLGLDWDEGPDIGGPFAPYDQSERGGHYEDALKKLIDKELAYPCWCSRKEIAEASSAPHGGTPVYPGTCRDLTGDERAARQAERPDRQPSWRFKVTDHAEVVVTDELIGEISQNVATEVGDFILKRTDGLWAYQHAVVVDDIDMGITDILRAEDLADSTPRQALLFRALGVELPRFWHVPLVFDADGNRMSKRFDSTSLSTLENEFTPAQLVGQMAASLGWVDKGTEVTAIELLLELDIERFRTLGQKDGI